jgi:PAS domain S-box-containing protein
MKRARAQLYRCAANFRFHENCPAMQKKDTSTAAALARGWPPKYYFVISILFPSALFFILIFTTELSLQQQRLNEQSLQQEAWQDKANQLRATLDDEFNSNLYLSAGIISYIQAKQGLLVANELEPWLTNLQERAQYIRNIGIAPQNRLSYVYPLAGNESALGLYYPDNAEQWPAVEKIIASKKPMLAGPLHLMQGGQGLIYRIPVYLADDSYWGLVSTVLNFDKIYKTLRSRAAYLGLKFAVIDRDMNNKIIFGDSDLTITNDWALNVPGRDWRILIGASQLAESANNIYFRLGGWSLSTIICLLFFVFLRSLAKQNKIHRELNASKFRFSQAFNAAPQGIALITQQGAFISFNEGLCNIIQRTQEELTDLTFFDITAPEHRDQLRDIILTTATSHTLAQQYQSVLIAKAKQPIDVIISIAPTDITPHSCEWIVQIIDISERIVFERLLRDEAKYNQRILNAIVDGIITLNNSGHICYANPAACNIFSLTPEKLIHQPISHIIQQADAEKIIHYIKQDAAQDNVLDDLDLNEKIGIEMLGRRSQDNNFPIEFQLSSIKRKQEKMYIAVIRDLSERKRLERLKNDFISTTSHELRTPLTSILGALKLLESGALGILSDATTKLVRIANQNGNKLALLINDLLDMDKLLSGKMQFNLEEQPLLPLVTQAIENIEAYAQEYQVHVGLDCSDESIGVNVDTQRLQQVLTNLLSNAAKFSPQGGLVAVHVRRVHNIVRIEIIDNGMGISPEAQANLFSKFYQVDSSSTRKAGGTGLGLAISKELIAGMKGTIGVNSQLGKGSCFYLELPIISRLT